MVIIRKGILLVCILLLLITGLSAGCGKEQTPSVQEVTFDQLSANPDKYNGRLVSMEGFYFHRFEIIVLAERLDYSGYAEGHLVPKGKMFWVEGGIPKEVYDSLYQQQMMGPLERYGKVRMTGTFEYGGRYGHLGAYNSQIAPSKVELLSWSLPAVPGATSR